MVEKKKYSNWGGVRPGAGRKRRPGSIPVKHTKRPKVDPDHPLLIIQRVVEEVRLDDPETWDLVLQAVSEQLEVSPGFDIQKLTRDGREMLLLVTAKNKKALTRGMQGLSVRMARRLNRLYGRSGSVFMARYEAEALETKKAVERALARF